MSNAMECPVCGEIELRELDCNTYEDGICTDYECTECGHFESHWGTS